MVRKSFQQKNILVMQRHFYPFIWGRFIPISIILFVYSQRKIKICFVATYEKILSIHWQRKEPIGEIDPFFIIVSFQLVPLMKFVWFQMQIVMKNAKNECWRNSNIYINDLALIIDSYLESVLFADDTTLYDDDLSYNLLISKFREILFAWINRYKLFLNWPKAYCFFFHLNVDYY